MVVIMLITLAILAGCSVERSQINEKKEEASLINNQHPEVTETTETTETTYSNDDWFAGKINDNLKIHLKLEKDKERISGTYYYEQDKKKINLTGDIYNKTFSLYGEGSNDSFEGVFISDNLIEGIWSDGENTYPLYLIKGESNTSIPKKPDNDLVKWRGEWSGKDATYYSGTDLIIEPIFNNLIRFELMAFSGTHTGGFRSFALVDNGTAIYKGENDVEFIFSLNQDGNIELDSNDYTYYCGYGVGYASSYVKSFSPVKAPNAKEVGLVHTEEQEAIFKEMTGEHYDTFISYAQYYSEEQDLDDMGVTVRTFGLRGYSNAAIVMINETDDIILVAVDGGDGVYYFTNHPDFKDPPKTIKNWLGDRKVVNVEENQATLEELNKEEQYEQVAANDGDIPQQFVDFMKQKDDKNNILYYEEEDIDNDGNNEVIIASGIPDDNPLWTSITHLYVLRENNEKVEQLSDNLADDAYGVYDIKLIRLQNLPGTYIYCQLTNGARLGGFKIFYLVDNQIKRLEYSASPTGMGFDTIKDFNNDGQFDGYIENRSSYDVLYYPITNKYILEKNEFILEETTVEMPKYPDNIKDVLMQYLALKILDNDKSIEIDTRLSELCINNKTNDIVSNNALLYLAVLNTMLDIEKPNQLTFTITESNTSATATATYTGRNNNVQGFTFHLIKKDNRWSIDNIFVL